MKEVEIVKFIRTELSRKGKGIEYDPVRIIIQYWDFDGNLFAEIDTWKREVTYFNFNYSNERLI